MRRAAIDHEFREARCTRALVCALLLVAWMLRGFV